MQVQFQYTFEDYREANLMHEQRMLRVQKEQMKEAQARRGLWFWLGIVFGVAMLLAWLPDMPVLASVDHLWMKLVGPFVPATIVGIGAILVARRNAYWGARKLKMQGSKSIVARVVAIVLLAVLLFIVAMALSKVSAGSSRRAAATPTATTREAPLMVELGVLLAPWVVIGIVVWSLIYRARGVPLMRKIWEGTPQFHRAHTLEADAQQVRYGDGLSWHVVHWPAFIEFMESENLFLLFTGDYFFLMIPKRAFDASGVDAFRSLAQSSMMNRTLRAFPVLPAVAGRMHVADDPAKQTQ